MSLRDFDRRETSFERTKKKEVVCSSLDEKMELLKTVERSKKPKGQVDVGGFYVGEDYACEKCRGLVKRNTDGGCPECLRVAQKRKEEEMVRKFLAEPIESKAMGVIIQQAAQEALVEMNCSLCPKIGPVTELEIPREDPGQCEPQVEETPEPQAELRPDIILMPADSDVEIKNKPFGSPENQSDRDSKVWVSNKEFFNTMLAEATPPPQRRLHGSTEAVVLSPLRQTLKRSDPSPEPSRTASKLPQQSPPSPLPSPLPSSDSKNSLDRSLVKADARRKARRDERHMKSIKRDSGSGKILDQPSSESFRKGKVLEILNLRNDSIRIEQERKEKVS